MATTVHIDADDLEPLVRRVISLVLAESESLRAEKMKERIAFTEQQAAELLGIPKHVLRDARLRGEIKAARAGKRVLYKRSDLLAFLDERME